MKHPYARQIRRDYRRLFLQSIFVDLPRLRRQKRRAERRGESVGALNAETRRIENELKKKHQLYMTARRSDEMLSRAGWQ